MITVSQKDCDECGTCISVCAVDAITLDEKIAIDHETCINCLKCVTVCPFGALHAETGGMP
jgi:ferredoxin